MVNVAGEHGQKADRIGRELHLHRPTFNVLSYQIKIKAFACNSFLQL